MLTIKRSVTRHFFLTHTAHFKGLRNKHTLGWHVMQSCCAQQRALNSLRIRLFLYGGERINRTTLLYTPYPVKSTLRNSPVLKYALPTGVHVTLDELRLTGEFPSTFKQTDNHELPNDLHVKETDGRVDRKAWDSNAWLSRPHWERNRAALLTAATRLLMRRGTQADLGENFSRKLSQAQPFRLQSRLENFHPQGLKLLQLQSFLISRYIQIFSADQEAHSVPLLRARQLPGLQESRRARRRRTKLRGILTSRGLYDLRPRLTTGLYTTGTFELARPHQLPFSNMLSLLSRQLLRTTWRRRRGVGLLHNTLRKTGRLVWDLPVCNYRWPLRQSSLSAKETASSKEEHFGIYTVSGVSSAVQNGMSVLKKSSESERLLRAFPFLTSAEVTTSKETA
jgi:hypothetical protein